MNIDLDKLRKNPKGVKFSDLLKVCERYFGKPRRKGTSHYIFRTPWFGDTRVNIQNSKGMAKAYQVRQVLAAVDKLQGE